MANATVSRLGQVNQAGGELALFLKIFGGEVYTAYKKATRTDGKHRVREITHGKSAQFPMMGRNTAAYHVPGTEITGTKINHAEETINIQGFLVSSAFLAEIDEAYNHYDIREPYSTECGQALAREYDKHVMRAMIAAARASNRVTGLPGGSQQTNALIATDANILASEIFDSVQNFAEKDIPEDAEKWTIIRPAQYYLLAANKDLLNKDWGGAGSLSQAMIPMVAGTKLVMSNLIPNLNDTATNSEMGSTTEEKDAYLACLTDMGLNLNFTKTVGIVTTRESAGCVKLKGLSIKHQEDLRRLGHLIVAKYAVGYGKLRPECAVELATP